MLDILIKQLMPPGFDMNEAMRQISEVGLAIKRTDERTAASSSMLQQVRDTLERVETVQARILALLEGQHNG